MEAFLDVPDASGHLVEVGEQLLPVVMSVPGVVFQASTHLVLKEPCDVVVICSL